MKILGKLRNMFDCLIKITKEKLEPIFSEA